MPPSQVNVTVGTLAAGADIAIGVEQGAKYELIGPDGTRAVFNDPGDIDHVGFLTAVPSGLDSPEVRESADVLVEADGGVHGDFWFGRRPFTLEGLIDPTPAAVPSGDLAETSAKVMENRLTNPRPDRSTGWQAGATLTLGAPVAGGGGGPVAIPSSYGAAMYGVAVYGGGTTTDPGAAGADGTSTTGLDSTPPAAAGTWQVISSSTASPPAAESHATVTAGDRIVIGCRLEIVTPLAGATGPVTLRVLARDAAGATIETPTLATQTLAGLPTGTLVDVIGVYPVAAGVARAGLELTMPVNAGATGKIRVSRLTAAVVTPGETERLEPFNGDSYPGNAFPVRTAWTGTAGASSSLLLVLEQIFGSIASVSNRRINKLQRASRALRGDAVLRWQVTDGPAVQVATARRQQPLRITERLPKRFLVAMVAADPHIYSQVVHAAAGTLGQTVTCLNEGSSDSPAVVTVRASGSITGPITLFNAATGESVLLTLDLVGNDVLVVDMYARSVQVTGSNRYDAVNFAASQWWDVQAGENPVTVSAAAGTGTFEVAYRDAWI